MRTLTTLLLVTCLTACGKDASKPAPAPVPEEPAPAPKVEPPRVEAPPPPADDGTAEIAQLVVKDVGSKALGGQVIEASCVSVSIVPAGAWTVAAARLKDCGDKTARTIVWLYKRQGSGKWNEDYVGQPPKCWKGVPPDIAPAVKIATQIPTC